MHSPIALALLLLAPLGGTSSPVAAAHQRDFPGDGHFRVGATRNVGQLAGGGKRAWREFGSIDEHLIARDTVGKGSELDRRAASRRAAAAQLGHRGLIDTLVGGVGPALDGSATTDSAYLASLSSASVASVESVESVESVKSVESVESAESASKAAKTASTTTDSTTTTTSTSTSSCDDSGLLGGILCGAASTTSSDSDSKSTSDDSSRTTTSSATETKKTSADDSTPTSKTSTSASCGDGLLDGLLCGGDSTSSDGGSKSTKSADKTTSSGDDDKSTSTKPSKTSATCGDGLLDDVLCGPASTTSSSDAGKTTDATTTSKPKVTKTSSGDDSASTMTSSCDGILDGLICKVSSALNPTSSSGTHTSHTSGAKETTTSSGDLISTLVSDVSSALNPTSNSANGTHVSTTSSGDQAATTTSSGDKVATTTSSSTGGEQTTSSSTGDASTSTEQSSSTQHSTSTSDDFIPSSTLLVTQPPSTITSAPTTTRTSTSGNKASTTSLASIPASTPQKIIPGNGQEVVQQPDGTTLISILFNSQLNWEWLVEISPNTSLQIFKYMPDMIGTSLELDSSNVTNYALVAYVPAGYNPDSDDGAGILSVWLGYIPQNSVSALQAYIKTPASPLYTTTTGIENELAQRIDPSLLITAYSSGSGAAGDSAGANGGSGGSGGGSSHSKTTIIAVVVVLGVIALALASFLIYRMANKSSSNPGPVRLADSDPHDNGPAASRRTTGFFGGFGAFGGGGGAVHLNRSPSSSTVGSNSSLGSYSSSGGHATDAGSRSGHQAHARSTSVDTDDRRASWWRYSQGSAGSGHSSQSGAMRQRASPNQDMPIMREGPRRIQVVRQPGGGYTGISKPVLQESSLLL